MLSLATDLSLSRLACICESYLLSKLNVQNAASLLIFSHEKKFGMLKEVSDGESRSDSKAATNDGVDRAGRASLRVYRGAMWTLQHINKTELVLFRPTSWGRHPDFAARRLYFSNSSLPSSSQGCLDFVSSNSDAVMESKEWSRLVDRTPDLVAELFASATGARKRARTNSMSGSSGLLSSR